MDTKTQKIKRIEVSPELRNWLIKKFNTSYVTVHNALTFRTKSQFSNVIRKAAVENGAITLKEV